MNDDFEELSPKEELHYLKKNYIASQYRIASMAYALVICLTGIVLITIEPFKACTKCGRDVKILVDLFFIYMYSVSIFWIIVMLVLIIVAKRQQKIAIKHPTGMNRRLSTTIKRTQSERIRGRQPKSDSKKSGFLDRFEKTQLLKRLLGRTKSTPAFENPNADMSDESSDLAPLPTSHPLVNPNVHHASSEADFNTATRFSLVASAAIAANNNKFYFTYDYENGTGELYMRVGTAIFAVCSLIDRSLSLIQLFEAYFVDHYAALTPECQLTFILSTIKIICSFLFIFMQTFFIFKYANIVINYGKNSAVLGLMHIMCTNFCVFVRTVILETVAEIRHHYHVHRENTSNLHFNTTGNHQKSLHIYSTHFPSYDNHDQHLNHTNVSFLTDSKLGCLNRFLVSTDVSIGIQEAQDLLGPYLYPCVIEYSLMCVTVFYVLWANIEQRYNIKNNVGAWVKAGSSAAHAVLSNGGDVDMSHNGTPTHHAVEGELLNNSVGHSINNISRPYAAKIHFYDKNPHLKSSIQNFNNPRRPSYKHSLSFEKRYANQFVIDCGKSTTGLFFGILTLLMTLISLIAYFIYKSASKERAVLLSEITELILVSLSLFTNIVTIIKIKMVKFDQKIIYSMGYNETLILIGLAGVYLFGFYSIIAVLDNGLHTQIEKLSFSIQVTTLIESTIQGIFIINGLKLFTRDGQIRKSKPGRSFVTLLILINVSLWMSDTFSIKKYDMNTIQLEYYNVVFWSIASSISAPLAIFYRFHSSVCLSDMWKTLYE